MFRAVCFVCLSVLLASPCYAADPQPTLYPNAQLKKTPTTVVQAEIRKCSEEAKAGLNEDGTPKNAVRSGVRTAAKGAALGALAGTITGKTGRGAGAGAAVGGVMGTAGAIKQGREGSPEYRKYVEACLEERGYKVVGWKP